MRECIEGDGAERRTVVATCPFCDWSLAMWSPLAIRRTPCFSAPETQQSFDDFMAHLRLDHSPESPADA